MDAQILQELVSIRWMVTGIAVVAAILVVGFVFAMVVNYSQALESVKKGDFFTHGNALLMKGELDELIERADKHLRDFPADAGAHWLKGTAHYRRKEWTQALICYRKADELQPGFAVGPSISEIQEKIANAGTPPDLKVVAPVTTIGAGTPKDESSKGR